MLWRRGCSGWRDARASFGAGVRFVSSERRHGGANLREAVTALSASGLLLRRALFAKFVPQLGAVPANLLCTSVVVGPSGDKICQKIIGRGCGRGGSLLRRGIRWLHDSRLAFAMFHQPAREHRGRVLFNPLINQRGNLFSQIRSVAETAEFVALQAVARSRQQEFPRRRNSETLHWPSRDGKSAMHSNATVHVVKH